MKKSAIQVDLRVALLYALFGGLWILLSDRLLAAFITDVSLLTSLQTYKGWAFVAISALLIYFLLRRELTLRRISEGKFEESEERYRQLFETSIDAFLLTAPDGSIHSANPAATHMFGWTEDEIKQLGRGGVVDTTDPRLAIALKERTSKGYFRGELTLVHKDGTKFPAEVSTAVFKDSQGKEQTSMVIRDITERVQAEEQLRENQLRMAGIINSAMDAILTLDANQNIILFNPAAEGLFRCPAEDAIGKPLDRFIPERFRETHRKQIRNFGETNQAKRSMGVLGPLICLRADGEEFPAEITISKTEMGEQKIYTAILRDITVRMQTEAALRESEQRFRSIFEQSPIGMGLIDTLNSSFIQVNPKYCEIVGRTNDEMMSLNFHMITHPDDVGKDQDEIQRLINGEIRSYNFDKRYIRPDQSVVWAHLTIVAMWEKQSEPKVHLTMIEDITERKQVEEALNRRVDELTALYQTTLDIINIHNLSDLLNTIVMRAVDLLGGTSGGLYLCDSEHKQAHCVVSYNTPADYTGTVLAYGEGAAGIVAATGQPLIINDYQTWEGRAKIFEADQPFSTVISAPMLWHGQVVGVLHVLHDIEKHKFTEEDLKLLTSFANQTAIAVENTRLFEETQRRLDRLAALRRIDQVITSSMDLRVTLNILLGQILQLLQVDAAAILLYQPELQNLKFVAGQGFRTRTLQSTNLHLGQGFAGQAALERHMVRIFDLEKLHTGFLRSPEFRNEEFVAYIGVPLIAKGNISGVLEIYSRKKFDPDEEWMDFLETLAGQAAIAIDNINLFNNLETSNLELIQAYDATIEGWARALEMRDMETEGHSRRVVDLTLELARRIGVEEKQLVHIRQGALLHDIGKMGVPDSILQKTDPLTDEEWEVIRKHPIYANKWLAPILYLQSALDIPYCHHEKWDGTGYPRGLEGEQIPLAARIFAVVDVWDALRSDRPYRTSWSAEKTRTYVLEQSGKHFDPEVIEIFLPLIENE